MTKKLLIRQKRSIIGEPERQKRTIRALGLGRPNWQVVHADTPTIRGMIARVAHLVEVHPIEEGTSGHGVA
ncbi:MAG: 50S ribosomal protein L30 [Bacteroidetes bacterium]|nr:50S ribosomal protein L30 [Rhodothermia bacterium]MCS7154562.1 50S ribosomal protein L30 [Bacteroidota bacterium]MCX7906279.1 50S ribosomal protein L30 [Bacteroidota bacterium]MDW8137355.1 50S ribosomal protein L30 [Bacteroidota bacterium]MDW8285691.1 50S ribosomal protein L30 [Bacteroidota bacterium]